MSEFIYFIVFLLCLLLPLIFMEAKTKSDEDKVLFEFERKQRDILRARIAYSKVHIQNLSQHAISLGRIIERDSDPRLKRIHEDLCYDISKQKDTLKMWEHQLDELIKAAHHDLVADMKVGEEKC